MIGNGLLVPTRSIPREGRSYGRPLIHGIRHYADFFNDRQKLHLHLLGSAINRVESDECGAALSWPSVSTSPRTACTRPMRLAIAEPAHCSPFTHTGTSPVRSNLTLGRMASDGGTSMNTVRKISKAIAFAKAPEELHPEGTSIADEDDFKREQACLGSVDDVLKGSATAAIQTQSSEDLHLLTDGSVDPVLTDPPYFEDPATGLLTSI